MNEKNSISQVLPRIRALENKHHNTERSREAPVISHHQTPHPQPELRGQLLQPPPATNSTYISASQQTSRTSAIEGTMYTHRVRDHAEAVMPRSCEPEMSFEDSSPPPDDHFFLDTIDFTSAPQEPSMSFTWHANPSNKDLPAGPSLAFNNTSTATPSGHQPTETHANRSSDQNTSSAPKRSRMCSKCAEGSCRGKMGIRYCDNVCRDCKQPSCEGRNSKYPDRTCREGKKLKGATGGRKKKSDAN